MTYAMGWYVVEDCDIGRYLTHGGGYPGYGSRVMLLPDRGVGIFVLTNRTYGGPSVPALKAALTLLGFETGDPRPPLRPAPRAVVAQLKAGLTALGLLEEETLAPS